MAKADARGPNWSHNMSETIITPKTFGPNLGELWRYRDLFYIFAWRDLKVRYKQTVLGVAWAVFQPVITMIVFTIFFGQFLRETTQGVPYPIFVYLGLVFWNYFSQSLTTSANSLVEHENIIKKIYFPRLVVPVAGTIAHLVDFGLASGVLALLMVYFKVIPHWPGLLLYPILMFITFLTAIGLGLFLAAINVKYRDVRYVIPFFIQLLIFVTPVIYPVTVISQRFRFLFYLNPMAGVIETARSSIMTGSFNHGLLVTAGLVAISYAFLGVAYFIKTERFFADLI